MQYTHYVIIPKGESAISSIEVLFCRENLTRLGDQALEQLTASNRTDLRLQVVKCLVSCSECASGHIARVNGQLVIADTALGLIEAIDQLVRQTANA